MNRRQCLSAMVALLLSNTSAIAQGKVRRVGYLSADSPVSNDSPTSGPVIEGLKSRGWIEGSTIRFERLAAEGKIARLPALVDELIADGVEAILTSGFPAVAA